MNSDVHGANSSAGTLGDVESSEGRRSEILQRFESLLRAGADLPLDEAFLTASAFLKTRTARRSTRSSPSSPELRHRQSDARVESSDPRDIIDHLVHLDELASEISSPTFEGIARHLFTGESRFRGNNEDYYDPANSYLDEVLLRKTGIPITLSVVTIEVARRLGVRMSGVGMPGHFLVGSYAPIGKIPDRFIDPFHGGVVLDVDGCRRLFERVTGSSSTFDIRFLASLHPIAIVDRALGNLKGVFAAAERLPELRSIMTLRSRLPGFSVTEREEFRRLMAPLN